LVFGANAGDSVQVAITSGSTLAVIPAIGGPANINIASGTLLVASGFGAGDVSIAGGAGFGGAGTVSGTVTAENGASLKAGMSDAGVAETLLLQGGLVLGSSASDIIQIDVSANKTLHIAVPLTGQGKLEKSGEGVLRLAGGNAGYTHALTVAGGNMVIDNGIGSSFVDVADGAAFGGAGAVSGSLSLGAGATLLVGAPGATAGDAAGRTLTVNGDFIFGAGGTLAFDLLKKGELGAGISTSLSLGAGQVFSGAADAYTINLQNILTGAYDLGNIGWLADSGSAAIKVGGNELGGRQSAWLEKDGGGNLILHADAGSSMKLSWMGVSPSWNTEHADWAVPSGSISFGSGDMVYFDSETDAGHEASRDIAISGASIITSGMEVSGTGNYRFSGAAIVTDRDTASEELEAEATGKLVKKGGGVLTLANTGANNFKGGVELEGGVLELAGTGALGANNLTITGLDTVLRFNSAGVTTTGTLDVDNHALTLDAALDGTLGGVITGTNTLLKTGPAMLTLDAAHAGAVEINEGVLRVGAGNSLADNAVAIAAGATLDLQLQNDILRTFSGEGNIEIGNTTLTVDNAGEITFAGSFSGSGNMVKTGTADLVLSGSSRHEGGTRVSAGRLLVTNMDALGAGIATVDAESDAVLEFNQVAGVRATAIIGGGTVDVSDSRLVFSGNNIISRLRLSGSTVLTVAGTGALGGAGANIIVGNDSMLRVANRATNPDAILANNITIAQGGALLFSSGTAPGKLELAGTLDFQTGATVGFDGAIASGIYVLATTNGIPNAPEYLASQHGMDVTFATNDNTLSVLAINQSASPSKDAALTFDAMVATMTAVYNRISESFLLPVTERQPGNVLNDMWFKGIASRADYETAGGRIGHTDETHVIVAGYDGLVNERYLLGLYAGATDGKMDAANKSHTDMQHQFGGAYGALRLGCFYAGIDGTAGWMQADSVRAEGDGEARGSHDAEYWGASAEIGFIIKSWKNAVLKPGLALHGMNIKMKNFKEHGPGALRVDAFSEHVVQSLLNLQATQKFRMFGRASMLDVMIGWRQTVHDSNLDVVASFATSPGNPVVLPNPGYARGGFAAGLGLRANLSRHGVFGLGYDYEVAPARSRHTLALSMRWLW
jgi:autotransporter-associated beta strand protein